MNINEARYIRHEQAKGDNKKGAIMQAFLVCWCGKLSVDSVVERSIPNGLYETFDQAEAAVKAIGPDVCRSGILAIYRTWFPGSFMGAIPIREWDYRTKDDGTTELSERELPESKVPSDNR